MEQGQGRQHSAGSRNRQTDKVTGDARLNVKTGQAKRSEHREDGGNGPSQGVMKIMQTADIHNESGCDTERNDIRQRVQLFAKFAFCAQCTGNAAVKSVSQHSDYDENRRHADLAVECHHNPEHAEQQISECEQTRK
ncbi:hypothetical protein D3C71_1577600 [compost metagenome]